MSDAVRSQEGRSFRGVRVAFLGKLSGMSRRDAQRLIRARGGIGLERPDATATLVVVGDEQRSAASLASLYRETAIDEATRVALECGDVQVIGETELWQRLGLVEPERHIQNLHTPASLADLLKVDVAIIRRWQRQGLIRPVRQVRKLPYFDFAQVLAARRLAELLASGVSPGALERRLAEWSDADSSSEQPLAGIAIVSRGRRLLRRQGDELIESSGQRWFVFAAETDSSRQISHAGGVETEQRAQILSFDARQLSPSAETPEALVEMAEELEDRGELRSAADLYRAALAAGGPAAATCFALAELLYRLGDLAAARERYFMAIELDADYVEARANLGCLLAEQGQLEMAVAAFEGALRFHPDYADAHYHLARALGELGRQDESLRHWQAFVRLAPDSPWATEARLLLELAGVATAGDKL